MSRSRALRHPEDSAQATAGIQHHIPKPVEPEQLVAIVPLLAIKE
jgi:hypothetical protein